MCMPEYLKEQISTRNSCQASSKKEKKNWNKKGFIVIIIDSNKSLIIK